MAEGAARASDDKRERDGAPDPERHKTEEKPWTTEKRVKDRRPQTDGDIPLHN